MPCTTRAIMKTYTTTICWGEKTIQKLILSPKPYKKNKTTMALTIYFKNKRSLNSSLLQKTREAQT
jgi:hypothetical protein